MTPAPPIVSHLRREWTPFLVSDQHRVDLELALRQIHQLLGISCVSSAGGGLNGTRRCGLVGR
jgi:hypothetical protein